MVVLASAITTKSGKTLISRQFVELTKTRIEGLLSAFPKLMSTDKQHTFVETESVRYVYQPIGEQLYIVLITNKSSNILEDLESLHLLAKIVPEYCHILEEKEILKTAFDLVFAFDEAIAMGYKERVNLQLIKQFTTMQSNDEIRARLEEQDKMKLAKKKAEDQRKAIRKKKMEEGKEGGGISSEDYSSRRSNSYTPRATPEPVVETKRPEPKTAPSSSGSASLGSGMQLGKSKTPNALSQFLKEENVQETESPKTQEKKAQPAKPQHKVVLNFSENITASVPNDGGLNKYQVRGELSVAIYDENYSKIRIQLNHDPKQQLQFTIHPNIDKTLFNEEGILALKDPSKRYQIDNKVAILKWRFEGKDESALPLSLNVWPNTTGKETVVPVEYEKRCPFDLKNFSIAIPVPGQIPEVNGEIEGETNFDPKTSTFRWSIPLIDSKTNNSGSMEFKVPATKSNSVFFPTKVHFEANHTLANIKIAAIQTDEQNSKPVTDVSEERSLITAQYDIE